MSWNLGLSYHLLQPDGGLVPVDDKGSRCGFRAVRACPKEDVADFEFAPMVLALGSSVMDAVQTFGSLEEASSEIRFQSFALR